MYTFLNKYFILFFLSYFTYGLLFADNKISKSGQTNKIDSLEKLLKKTNDEGKVKVYNELSNEYLSVSVEKTWEYAQKALKLSNTLNNFEGKADALTNIGLFYRYKGNSDSAFYFFRKSLEINEKTKNKKGTAKNFNCIGTIYLDYSDYKKALIYYQKSFEVYKELDDKKGIARASNNMANLYRLVGRYEDALKLYQQSLKTYQLLNSRREIADVFCNLGNLYKDLDNNNKAKYYYRKSLEIYSEIGNTRGVALLLNNIGNNYYSDNDNEKALEYFRKSLELCKKIQEREGYANCLNNIGNVYDNTGKHEEALNYYSKSMEIYEELGNKERISSTLNNIGNVYQNLKQYDNAIYYYKKCNVIAEEIKNARGLINNYEEFSKVYAKMKNYQEALAYYKKYTSLKDSVFNEKNRNNISTLEVNFETEKKEREIELLQRDKKIYELQKYALGITIAFVLIICGLIFIYQRKNNKKNKIILTSKLKNAQMEVEYKNKELLAMGSQIIQKNDLLNDLKNNLKDLDNYTDPKIVIRKLNILTKRITYKLKVDKDRKELLNHMELINNNFYLKLKQQFPDLTDNQLRLAALLKLNISSKDISVLFNVSEDSIEQQRHRLRKKLNLDSKISITDFFNNLLLS